LGYEFVGAGAASDDGAHGVFDGYIDWVDVFSGEVEDVT
jgi:hypothetical protein